MVKKRHVQGVVDAEIRIVDLGSSTIPATLGGRLTAEERAEWRRMKAERKATGRKGLLRS